MNPDRPLWFLGEGAMPVPAAPRRTRKDKPRPPSGVTHWCREGDLTWHPIATFLAPTTPGPEGEADR